MTTRVPALLGLLWIIGAGTAALPAQPGPASTAPAPVPGRLLGVFDELSGDPVSGATVSDALSGDHTVTSATGTVSLWFIRPTGSVVQVRKIGYEPWSSVIDPTDTVPITVVLKKVTELATVVTTAKLNMAEDPGLRGGFEQRCQDRRITCVHEDELIEHPTHTIGDFVSHASGVVCGRGSGCGIFMHSLTTTGTKNGSSLCTPTYFIDGFVWDPRAQGGQPIDNPGRAPTAFFNPSTVKQVEVYSPEVPRPLRFEGNPQCGAIVIWTK